MDPTNFDWDLSFSPSSAGDGSWTTLPSVSTSDPLSSFNSVVNTLTGLAGTFTNAYQRNLDQSTARYVASTNANITKLQADTALAKAQAAFKGMGGNNLITIIVIAGAIFAAVHLMKK